MEYKPPALSPIRGWKHYQQKQMTKKEEFVFNILFAGCLFAVVIFAIIFIGSMLIE